MGPDRGPKNAFSHIDNEAYLVGFLPLEMDKVLFEYIFYGILYVYSSSSRRQNLVFPEDETIKL